MKKLFFLFLFVLSSCVSSNSTDSGLKPSPSSLHNTWKEPITGMVFVWVPAGCFEMGSNLGIADLEEQPVHKVCLNGYWIGKYEVTQEQWENVMGSNPSKDKKGGMFPVESISWDEAKKYIISLNQKTGLKFRFPTEAEWEYAASSGGKDKILAGGDNINKIAWHSQNSRRIRKVGTKKPNDFGLHDMNGNVLEWCEDVHDRFAYKKHSQENPIINSGSNFHVLRGGSWKNYPGNIRITRRYDSASNIGHPYFGFRLCISETDQQI